MDCSFVHQNSISVWFRLIIEQLPRFPTFQRKEYVKYAKVFPLTTLFDIKIASKWYRRVVGSLEMLSGLAMMVIPNRKWVKQSHKLNSTKYESLLQTKWRTRPTSHSYHWCCSQSTPTTWWTIHLNVAALHSSSPLCSVDVWWFGTRWDHLLPPRSLNISPTKRRVLSSLPDEPKRGVGCSSGRRRGYDGQRIETGLKGRQLTDWFLI